jgi:hypothetical protein
MKTRLRLARIPGIAVVLVLAACSGSDTGNAGDTTDAFVAADVVPVEVAETDAAEGVVGADMAEESAPADIAIDTPSAEVAEEVVPADVATDALAADVDTLATDVPKEDEGAEGPTLEFVIVGDPDSDVTFQDSYASQTPAAFFVGVQKVELLASADDPSPVTVFDAGDDKFTEVDMQASTSLATIDLFQVLSGTYTHARIQLATARFAVQATVHPPFPVPSLQGPVSVVAALGDTVIDSTPRSQDWVQYSFSAGGFPFVKTGALPPFPRSATGTVIKESGRTWLQMELSEHLTIAPSLSMNYVATVRMKTKNCFRWEDQSTSGHATGVFDTDSSGNSEPVESFGPGDYSIVVAGAK